MPPTDRIWMDRSSVCLLPSQCRRRLWMNYEGPDGTEASARPLPMRIAMAPTANQTWMGRKTAARPPAPTNPNEDASGKSAPMRTSVVATCARRQFLASRRAPERLARRKVAHSEAGGTNGHSSSAPNSKTFPLTAPIPPLPCPAIAKIGAAHMYAHHRHSTVPVTTIAHAYRLRFLIARTSQAHEARQSRREWPPYKSGRPSAPRLRPLFA